MLRRSSLVSVVTLALAASLSTACMSEYELHVLEDPLDICDVGCTLDRASWWHNPNETSQAGFAVEIAAWGYQEPAPGPGGAVPLTGYTVDKKRRAAFAGAPYYSRGRVYYLRAGFNDGLLASVTPQTLLAPYAQTSEFGYSLLAADVRNGHTYERVGGILQFTGPKAFGEEIIVGAPGTNDDTGEIYWYKSQANVTDPWLLGGAFVPANAVGGDRFGSAIAMSHKLDARFPDEVSTAIPNWIAVGAPGGDKVFILDVDATSNTPFSVIQTLQGPAGSDFGTSLAVADFDGDGFDDLAVGAPNDNGVGRVHVFTGQSGATPLASLHRWMQSTLSGAGDHGFSLAAGFFRRNGASKPALVVGDPGRNDGNTLNAGGICQYQFKTGTANVALEVDWSRCDAAPVTGSDYRFGHAVAVGNFFATNGVGASNGSCGAAEEVAVGSPGETEFSSSPAVPVMFYNGAVRILALGEDGAEPGEPATQVFRGAVNYQGLGKALASEYVQRTIHEDLLIGSPDRDGLRGSYTLTRAEAPNGACAIAGKWRSTDSDGNPFNIQISWDGANLHVEMLNDAAIRAEKPSGVCSIVGTDVDFEGAIPIDPIPWTTCGVTTSAPVELDISDEVGFSAHVEGTLSYNAASNTFTLDIDEQAGVLAPMDNDCAIVNGPFVFTQVASLTCE